MRRTAVELLFAGAESARLARVRVSARVVGSPYAHSRSSLGRRRGARGWDTTMVPRRVCGTVVTSVTVYLAWVQVVSPRLT